MQKRLQWAMIVPTAPAVLIVLAAIIVPAVLPALTAMIVITAIAAMIVLAAIVAMIVLTAIVAPAANPAMAAPASKTLNICSVMCNLPKKNWTKNYGSYAKIKNQQKNVGKIVMFIWLGKNLNLVLLTFF